MPPARVSPLASSRFQPRPDSRSRCSTPPRGTRAGSTAMGEKPGRGRGRGRKEDAWQGRPLHTTMKRVKVYRLEDNGKWDDQGTGHVTIDYIEGSRELVLAVVDEEDNDTLLLHNITPDNIYRKQQETIISWRDPEKALELALSFQEAEGCSFIWENMRNIREDLQSEILSCKSSSSANGELKELLALEMSSLSLILKTMQCGTTEQKQLLTDSISKDRVKVYRLEDNGKWDDQGTGHVTIDYIEGSRELVLAVVDEEDNDTLLLHNITRDDIYRKQDETIISWRDPEKALEFALSFQEAENMRNIREDLQSKILSSLKVGPKPALKPLVASRGSPLHGKTSSSVNGELKELPPLEMSSISVILKNPLASVADGAQLSRDSDLSPGQPMQRGMPSSGHEKDEIASTYKYLQKKKLRKAREVARISDCSNHNLLSRKISAACMTLQPLPICCELLVSAMDSKGCLCKLILDGTKVDMFLAKYIPCGGQHPNFVEETKNCTSLFRNKSAPAPKVAAPPRTHEFDAPPPPREATAPTPEVAAPTPDKPSKSKIHWLLVVLVLVVIAGLLIFVCLEVKKWKDAGRVAPNAPQSELTATVIPNKRQTADVMICNQALDIPINDAIPFLPLTRSRLNSARQ